MFKTLMRCAVIALALAPVASAAEPIKLRLAFFSSDRANVYLAAIKPFVGVVNGEAKGLIDIEVHFSGALGKLQAEQAQLVVDGKADIAFVTPGLTPDQFPDNTVVELPGLYRDMREATLVYTRLSGEWTAERFIKNFDVVNVQMMEQLKSDPKRTVVFPSKSDMERADAAFRAVTDEAMDKSPHSRELLRAAKSEIAKLRASE